MIIQKVDGEGQPDFQAKIYYLAIFFIKSCMEIKESTARGMGIPNFPHSHPFHPPMPTA